MILYKKISKWIQQKSSKCFYSLTHTVADDRVYDRTGTDNSDCTGHAASHDRKYPDLSAQSDYCQPVRNTVSPVT